VLLLLLRLLRWAGRIKQDITLWADTLDRGLAQELDYQQVCCAAGQLILQEHPRVCVLLICIHTVELHAFVACSCVLVSVGSCKQLCFLCTHPAHALQAHFIAMGRGSHIGDTLGKGLAQEVDCRQVSCTVTSVSGIVVTSYKQMRYTPTAHTCAGWHSLWNKPKLRSVLRNFSSSSCYQLSHSINAIA
jgi:hypothetical protein